MNEPITGVESARPRALFSVVIPLIPAHDKHVFKLMRFLSLDTSNLQEVIICRSESSSRSAHIFSRKLKTLVGQLGFSIPVRVSFSELQCNDGLNRNRGAEIATADYLLFLDADDEYHPNRTSFLQHAIELSGSDALLHGYSLSKLDDPNLSTLGHVDINSFAIDPNGLLTVSNLSTNENWHNAHLTARRSVVLANPFLSMWPGADQELVTRLVKMGYKVNHVNLVLSRWVRQRPIRYHLRNVLKRIAREIGPKADH